MENIFKGKATPELAATRMMERPVRTTVQWPGNPPTTRIIDWGDRKAVHRFGNMANRALRAGGLSLTEAINVP